jgi:hypothetical protein
MARARRSWKRGQSMLNSTRLVFIDETAANTKMVRAASDWLAAYRRDTGKP